MNKPLKKKPIPIGKIGKANREARRIIAQIAEERNLNHCELGLTGCTKFLFLAPAHRHKRAWYKGDVAKLSDYKQWIAACTNCHNVIEVNRDLTEGVFEKLRGEENA